MNIKINYTEEAIKARDDLIATDPTLKSFFAATFESLKQGAVRVPPNGEFNVYVDFTRYSFVLEVETDRIVKIKYIDITDVR